MPELPEVESLRQSLLPFVIDQKITHISVTKPKLVSEKGTKRSENQDKVDEFIEELTKETIINISRRAKNLIFETQNNKILLVHLKMTGQLVFQNHQRENQVLGGHPIQESENTLPNKHSHVIFTLSNGTLYFNDTRMFGYLLYYPNYTSMIADKHFDKLGLEPLDVEFTLEQFRRRMKTKTGVLKKIFLDQSVVVGLGNIYADEVCFYASVRPSRAAKTLKKSEIEKLYYGIITILPRAVAAGGSSVANYLLADGSKGNYAHQHKVYGRAGKSCLTCSTVLEKIILAGRTTVFCPKCQK